MKNNSLREAVIVSGEKDWESRRSWGSRKGIMGKFHKGHGKCNAHIDSSKGQFLRRALCGTMGQGKQ